MLTEFNEDANGCLSVYKTQRSSRWFVHRDINWMVSLTGNYDTVSE